MHRAVYELVLGYFTFINIYVCKQIDIIKHCSLHYSLKIL